MVTMLPPSPPEPVSETPPAPDELHTLQRRANFNQLSVEDMGRILEWADQDIPQTEIAQRLGKNQSSISRCLRKLGRSSVPIAKRIAEARAYRSVTRLTRIAEKSPNEDVAVKAGKAVLEVAGLTGQGLTGVSVGVQVIIGAPGQAAVDAQTITVTSVDRVSSNGGESR